MSTVGIPKSSQHMQSILGVFAVALFLVVWFLVWFLFLASPVNAQSAKASTLTVSGATVNSLAVTSVTAITATPTCPPSWGIVNSPNPSASTNYLFGVAAVSSNDIWAVGVYNPTTSTGRTLTLHWDGIQWTQVPSPSPGNVLDQLLDVEAISPNDVWAVGYTYSSGNGQLPLVEHWDGTQWSIVPCPNPRPNENFLTGVSAVSSNDVWAVGYYSSGNGYRNLVEHWDGTQWSIVPSPNVGSVSNQLWDVSAVSSNDVWAVGLAFTGAGALIEHWNGTQWSIIPNPDPAGTQLSNLEGVSALSSNDVWAVGRWADATVDHTLIKHWDGVQWSVVASPDMVPRTNWLYDVSPISPTDVWAVGYYCCGGSGAGTLAMHWDGVLWSIVPSPNVVGNNNFKAVAAISSSDVWGVGRYGGSPWYTLIEHYSITDACLTPSPTPTSTSTRTPTYTRTSTRTITPTIAPTLTPTFETTLVGHVYWESRPPQPDQSQILPVTLTLQARSTERVYPTQTDLYGFFTVTLDSLPPDTYDWHADDALSPLHSPNYLASSGVINISLLSMTNLEIYLEIGMMKTGDADDNNRINVSDFNILKVSFGGGCEGPPYDRRADFTGDCIINAADFAPLKRNFGQAGASPNDP